MQAIIVIVDSSLGDFLTEAAAPLLVLFILFTISFARTIVPDRPIQLLSHQVLMCGVTPIRSLSSFTTD